MRKVFAFYYIYIYTLACEDFSGFFYFNFKHEYKSNDIISYIKIALLMV